MPYDFMQSTVYGQPQFFTGTSVGTPPWSAEEWQAFVERTVAEGPPPGQRDQESYQAGRESILAGACSGTSLDDAYPACVVGEGV